jgi:hypothetical protein
MMEASMAGKDVAVKKYVVRLSAEERAELETLSGRERARHNGC